MQEDAHLNDDQRSAMSMIDKIEQQALQLPFEQREALALRLLGSVHPPAEDMTEEEWKDVWGQEIEQRLAAVDRGEFAPGNWRDVIGRLRGSAAQEREE